jgi:hypothetical protein
MKFFKMKFFKMKLFKMKFFLKDLQKVFQICKANEGNSK